MLFLHTSRVFMMQKNGDNEVVAWGSGKPMREFFICR